jgi:hypothetical protein
VLTRGAHRLERISVEVSCFLVPAGILNIIQIDGLTCDIAANRAQAIRFKLGHHLLGYPLMQPIPSAYLVITLGLAVFFSPFLAPLVRCCVLSCWFSTNDELPKLLQA